MKCLVCSAKMAGFLYTIRSCRACAAFFRRTIQMKQFYCCEKDGECLVHHGQRCCRYCRMKKCLTAGMSTEGSYSLADYYLQGIPPTVATTSSQDFESASDEDELNPDDCFRNHGDFETSVKRKIINVLKKEYKPPKQPFKLNLCQQSARAFELFNSKFEDVRKKEADLYSAEETEKFLSGIYLIMIRVAEFFMEIKPFANLPFLDKLTTFKKKSMSFGDIAVAANTIKILGTNLEETKCVHLGGQVFDFVNAKFDMSTLCNGQEAKVKGIMDNSVMDYDKTLYRPFKIVNPDSFEVQYLLMKVVWNLEDVEGVSVETLLLAESVQSQLDEELSYYYNYEKGLQNVASRIYKLHNLMTAVEKIATLREDDKQIWKMFDIFKFDFWIDDLSL